MRRHWVQRAVSADGRAIAEASDSVSIPDGIQGKVRRSSTVYTISDHNGSYSSSHSSIRVEWSAQVPET